MYGIRTKNEKYRQFDITRNHFFYNILITALKIYRVLHRERCKSKISDTRGCLRFNNLAPFTVFDSFSHPFLSCQCLFILRKYRVLSLVSNSRK